LFPRQPQNPAKALIITRSDDEYSSGEFAQLAASANFTVVAELRIPKRFPVTSHYVGSGKLSEIQALCKASAAQAVLFDAELSSRQKSNLEKTLDCQTLDRSETILRIFALRAHTHEGKLQVETARIEYLTSQLVRSWSHLDRQKGGIGLRGAGETQLELDQRMLNRRLAALRKKLGKMRSRRAMELRTRARRGVLTVSLVGYTNAGKTSLFNRLTASTLHTADMPFATLDPTLRRLAVPGVDNVVLADTVGFIRDLPHQLIDAFKATLEEVCKADLLLHVVDASDPQWLSRIAQVDEVLQEIGASDRPCLIVMNKVDLLHDSGKTPCPARPKIAALVSAHTSAGVPELLHLVAAHLAGHWIRIRVLLAPHQGAVRAKLYKIRAIIEEKVTTEGRFDLHLQLPTESWADIESELLASGGSVLQDGLLDNKEYA